MPLAEAGARIGRPLRVLIVTGEDSRVAQVRSLLDAVLPAHVLDRAPRYPDAARLASSACDVVLADLPIVPRGADGTLDREAFRSLPVPVVVIAADEDVGGDHEAMYAGAADCLGAGSMTAVLLERSLRYAVERHRETKVLRERVAALADNEFVHHSTFNDAPVGIAHVALDGRWLAREPAHLREARLHRERTAREAARQPDPP